MCLRCFNDLLKLEESMVERMKNDKEQRSDEHETHRQN